MKSTARVFVLVAMVVVTLLLMHQLPTFSINGTELRKVDMLADLFPETESEVPTVQVPPTPKPKKPFTQYRPKGVTLIEDFSGGKAGGMDYFYSKLLTCKNSGNIRIAYFGDSFIEGDIMTCDLRERLQAKYGGGGPGWVDCGGSMCGYKPTVKTNYSNIQEFVVTKKPFNSSLEAISQRYFVPSSGASLRFTATKYRPHVGNWNKATLFFRTSGAQTISVGMNGQEAESKSFEGMAEVQALETQTSGMTSVAYRFPQAGGRMQLMGVALDGSHGVALDNFSMRGSAGYPIADIPLNTLKELGHFRPYDLIVLHFGLNVVDNNSSEKMCRAYINRMKKAVERLRTAFPKASILIVSVPDRVQRMNGGFQTLKGIQRLAAYQRIMASECGTAYLSVFDIMGEKGGMKAFVDNGWAAKDYTHMNFKGGGVIAEQFFKSIEAGLENYKRAKAAK